MTTRPIIHEYKDFGRLHLESIKIIKIHDDTVRKNYSLCVNFEDFDTSVVHRIEYDDNAIRDFCTILNSDPDLLEYFLMSPPDIAITPQAIIAEFSQTFDSKLFTFVIQIPKLPEDQHRKVVELQQKNKILADRIKTLEESLAQQQKQNNTLTNICAQSSFRGCFADENVSQWIGIIGDQPQHFDTLLKHIGLHDSVIGDKILDMLKIGKLPKLKEYLDDNRKELYPWIIGQFEHSKKQLDRILRFCQLEIPCNITYTGQCYFPNEIMPKNRYKNVEYSMLEYFNHQITVYKDQNPYEFITGLKSPEFSETRNEIRKLLTKLQIA